MDLLLRGRRFYHEAVDVGRGQDQLLFLRQRANCIILSGGILQPVLSVVSRVVLLVSCEPPLGRFLFDSFVRTHFGVGPSVHFLAVLLDVDLIEHAVAAQVVVEPTVPSLATLV